MTGSRKVVSVLMAMLLTVGPTTMAMADEPQLNFKIYSPNGPLSTDSSAQEDKSSDSASSESLQKETPVADTRTSTESSTSATSESSASTSSDSTATSTDSSTSSESSASTDSSSSTTSSASSSDEGTTKKEGKVLQGYIRVVPTGTKVPIIMDTAVDSDTSQEGDEFSARTAEDLTIDGSTVVPAGSIIRGRIAQLNSPRALNRSGSVALKFDTVTTPDNRQIPLVANLVARGGVVHARRGMKDIALDTGTVMLPTLAGLGIGLLAGGSGSSGSSSSIGRGGGAVIGAGVGIAVGVAVLLAKKGKKVDVRPGDELKIELAEDLRMPMM